MKVRHLTDPDILEAGLQADNPVREIEEFYVRSEADKANFRGMVSEKLDCREVTITKRDGVEMRVCIYSPLHSPKQALPGILFSHGGGFACGIPEGSIPTIERLMAWSPCVVVCPDYRLSVEAPFPAAIEDCYEALLWLKENMDNLSIRHDQIFLAGESAGGGLTASLALMARDRGEVSVAFQMPLYPMLDNTMATESMKDNDCIGWNEAQNDLAWKLYLGENYRSAEVSKYASALRETDYRDLPPCYSFVGSCDPFLDETREYARNLEAAGVEAHYDVYEGGFHGFENLCPTSPIGTKALLGLKKAYQYAVKNYFAKQK